MNAPDTQLMQVYGTEDLYLQKLAGAESMVGPLSMAVLNWQLGKNRQLEMRDQRRETQLLNALAAQEEHERMRQAEQAMEYTPPPYSSMMRLASIAAGAGQDMAKAAGIGDFASGITKALSGASGGASGFLQKAGLTAGSLKWKLPLAGAALGAGALAMKAGKGALNYMNKEPGPSNWGSPGPQLANGVNQYGQPQVGSQF